MPANVKSARHKLLALIHIAKKDMAMTDDDYRAFLYSKAKVYSSANLAERGLREVIDEFKKMGWGKERKKQTGPHQGKPKNMDSGSSGPQLKKIEAILAEAKRPWSYAHGMAKRMFKVEKVEWLTIWQRRKLIGALLADAKRHGRRHW